eukprot:185678-Prymnesium_polylepis.3
MQRNSQHWATRRLIAGGRCPATEHAVVLVAGTAAPTKVRPQLAALLQTMRVWRKNGQVLGVSRNMASVSGRGEHLRQIM